MPKRLKKKVYELLDATVIESRLERFLNILLMVLIFLNVLAVILETEERFYVRHQGLFRGFEVFSVAVFTVEYLLRLWSVTESRHFHRPLAGRLRYLATPMALVDLLAILPFYLPMLLPIDLRFLRALRLMRIFRLLKMGRYVKSLRLMRNVLASRREELLITIFSVLLLLVLSSSLMYFIEREAQPDKFASIPAAMWWGIATLTTIGYGDMYPVTALGKMLGGFIALLGIGLFALPAGILASGFAAEIQKRDQAAKCCPHCGERIEG